MLNEKHFGKRVKVVYCFKDNTIWLDFKFKGAYCEPSPDFVFIGWL